MREEEARNLSNLVRATAAKRRKYAARLWN